MATTREKSVLRSIPAEGDSFISDTVHDRRITHKTKSFV